jgi:hypothetical protein
MNTGSKVALVVIFNHRYDSNIEQVERIYRKRFSYIYHLVPFYDGDRPNVIPVYESSHRFQGYIAQAMWAISPPRADFSHYLFIADDLLLNPAIDETNCRQHFRLANEDTSFINFLHTPDAFKDWKRAGELPLWDTNHLGMEAGGELPDYATALQLIERHTGEAGEMRLEKVYTRYYLKKCLQRLGDCPKKDFRRQLKYLFKPKHDLAYPMVSSYSDIFAVGAKAMKDFCHYCGVFAATGLFVEVALPTALAMASKYLITDRDMALHGEALWTEADAAFLKQYNLNLQKLLDNFPPDMQFLHPIKLSKWRFE